MDSETDEESEASEEGEVVPKKLDPVDGQQQPIKIQLSNESPNWDRLKEITMEEDDELEEGEIVEREPEVPVRYLQTTHSGFLFVIKKKAHGLGRNGVSTTRLGSSNSILSSTSTSTTSVVLCSNTSSTPTVSG